MTSSPEHTLLAKAIEGAASRGCFADVYMPKKRASNEPAPVAIYIHGGAFIVGDRTDIPVEQAVYLLEHGFAVVSIEYRKLPHVNLDVMRQDCLDAYKWIFDKLPDLIGIDLDQSRVLVCGHSAGALLTAFLAHDIAQDKLLPNVKCVLLGYGYLGWDNFNLNESKDVLKRQDEMADALSAEPVVIQAKFYDYMTSEEPLKKLRFNFNMALLPSGTTYRWLIPSSNITPGVISYPSVIQDLASPSTTPTALIHATADRLVDANKNTLAYFSKLSDVGADVRKWDAKGADHAFDLLGESGKRGGSIWEETIEPAYLWAISKTQI